MFFSVILMSMNMKAQNNMVQTFEKATLGGGCFWCLEAVFERVRGVESVVSGYSGGKTIDPTYEEVCGGYTGHAEVVQITFNPSVVSYEKLLEVFFAIHDPTTLNRQGADVGTQYRSVVFYHNPLQEEIALKIMADLSLNRVFGAPVVTEVKPLDKFYVAEKYHQNYYSQNTDQPYCRIVIGPKLEKLKKEFQK
ncbi:MAG: peptide-methionine (S)-S-oxide reductase MsrA [Breznakibacter sp.]